MSTAIRQSAAEIDSVGQMERIDLDWIGLDWMQQVAGGRPVAAGRRRLGLEQVAGRQRQARAGPPLCIVISYWMPVLVNRMDKEKEGWLAISDHDLVIIRSSSADWSQIVILHDQ